MGPFRRHPGCCVPQSACVGAVCWGRGLGGARVTRCLRPVGGWSGEAGGMLGVWRQSLRSRTVLAGVRCPAASVCRHVRRAIGRHAGLLVFWRPVTQLGISIRGGPRAGRSAAGSGASFRCRAPPRFLCGVHRGPLALRLGGRYGRRGCVVCQLRRRLGLALWRGCRPGPASHVACQCSRAAIPLSRGGPGCRCPPLGMWDYRWELEAWRGASAGTVACVGSGSGSGQWAG